MEAAQKSQQLLEVNYVQLGEYTLKSKSKGKLKQMEFLGRNSGAGFFGGGSGVARQSGSFGVLGSGTA